jgi:hypothetical protein
VPRRGGLTGVGAVQFELVPCKRRDTQQCRATAQDEVMTQEHFEQLLVELSRRSPFHPFTVELHGGDQFEVDHPQAMVVRDGVAVFLRPGGIPVWFDHESVTQIVGDIADRAT